MKTSTIIPGAPPAAVRVLIVEDEPRLRDLLIDEIADMAFQPTGVRSAEEALRLLAGDAFGITLLDLELPQMNGLELFERIRQQWPATQIVILTGNGSLDAAKQAIRLDVVDFLTKPCPLRDLEIAMDRARRRLEPVPTNVILDEVASTEATASESLTLAAAERDQILAALARANGNRTAAASSLGISRRTLHYRLSEYQKQGYQV